MVNGEAVRRLAKLLKDITEDTEFEAREIVKEYSDNPSPFNEIKYPQYELCAKAVSRRIDGEPLQYIFGHWEFYGLDFSVGEGVLIPRADTETVTELVIKHLKEHNGKFIDLCAGSGCIGIAAAIHSGCNGYSVELSSKAAEYCAANIKKHKLSDRLMLIRGDIFDKNVTDRFSDSSLEAIVSNPPYVNAEEMDKLQREVKREPTLALYGGKDGLDYYRRIFSIWKSKLKVGGLFAVEVGDGQADSVCKLMRDEGFSPDVYKDLAGICRTVAAVKK